MKKIVVIYRENDLYKKIVPKIIEWLKNLGNEPYVIGFPDTTNKDEIRGEIKKHMAVLANSLVVSDMTCRHLISYEDEKANSISCTNTLDFLCDKAIKIGYGATFKKGYSVMESSNADESEIIISNLIGKIKDRGIIPEKIYVVTDCTGDHSPFNYWDNGVNDDYESKRKYEKERVAPVIAQWFDKKFENKVEVVSVLKNKKLDSAALEAIDTPKTWVIMDRHLGGMMKRFGLDRESFFKQATVLRLPIPDFIDDVHEHKILEIADELFTNEECLKKLIEEEVNKA